MAANRNIWPVHRYAAERHLLRLAATDRRLRFGATIDDAAVRTYVRDLPWSRTMAFGQVHTGEIVGLAELHWAPPTAVRWPDVAELSVSVDLDARQQGIGTALIQRALTAARNRGTDRVAMLCLTDNQAMRRLAARFHPAIVLDSGEALAEVRLARPTQLSWLEESMMVGAAVFDTALDPWRRTGTA